MPIVFRFNSMDARERATLVIDSPEQAAEHVTNVLNQGRLHGPDLWTLDEDGDDVPTFSELTKRLRGWYDVKLYDQGNYASGSIAIIRMANALQS